MPWSLKKSIPNSAVLRIPFVSTTYTESVQMRIQAYVAVVLFRGYKSLQLATCHWPTAKHAPLPTNLTVYTRRNAHTRQCFQRRLRLSP